MIALQYACNSGADQFAVFESDYGVVHLPLETLPFPRDWCLVNVCPTSSAEPSIKIRRAVSPHDFGSVAVVYNHGCICNKLKQMWRRFTSRCEPFDVVVHDLPGSYRTGVMWVEHNYKPSSHSNSYYHKLGPVFVETARRYHALNNNVHSTE